MRKENVGKHLRMNAFHPHMRSKIIFERKKEDNITHNSNLDLRKDEKNKK